jgi:hypothetical protein
MDRLDRRSAVLRAAAAIGAVTAAKFVGASRLIAQSATLPAAGAQPKQKPAPLADELVREFVGAAHTNLDKVKQMLAEEPHLVNATWDWGGGDFETALGGASHMGRPDIAAVLLASGARLDLFCATMMGKIEIVRTCIADNPAIVHVKGPHGITLLRHAQMGKQDAVAAVLTAAGAT